MSDGVFVHPAAIVETDSIGPGSRVWAFAHVMNGARVGANANIGDHCFIESGVVIGDDVTIKNGCMIWEGVSIEDGAFIGPGVCFTNDRRPRSPRLKAARGRYADKRNWLVATLVKRGATIGARATIAAGASIGVYAMIGVGAVVTRNVADYQLVLGNPARHAGWVCECGAALSFDHGGDTAVCPDCRARYLKKEDLVVRLG